MYHTNQISRISYDSDLRGLADKEQYFRNVSTLLDSKEESSPKAEVETLTEAKALLEGQLANATMLQEAAQKQAEELEGAKGPPTSNVGKPMPPYAFSLFMGPLN